MYGSAIGPSVCMPSFGPVGGGEDLHVLDVTRPLCGVPEVNRRRTHGVEWNDLNSW